MIDGNTSEISATSAIQPGVMLSNPGGSPSGITSGGDEFSHFFEVKLELFDGPIDLLLHLVKQNELPLEKVSLAQVTGQYLACIEKMRRYDLDIAGEYLVIAATLLSMKSCILLNEPVELVPDEEGNLIDPHDELLRRLREAEIFREGVAHLSCSEQLGIDVFAAPCSLHGFEPPPVTFRQHDAILLGQAFVRLIERSGADKNLITITFEAVSIVDRMMDVITSLKTSGGRARFTALIGDRTSRGTIIASFLALLELCKRQAIAVEQSELFGEIDIVLLLDGFDARNTTSEFDAEVEQEQAQQ